MSEDLALSGLVGKLKERREKELQEVQKIEQEILQTFIDDLKAFVKAELNTTKTDIEIERHNIVREFKKMRRWAWIAPLIGISIVIGLGIGSWKLTQYTAERWDTLQTINQEIAKAQKKLKKIQKRRR